MKTVGLQFFAGGTLGHAIAQTDCVNGKYFEAKYFVGGTSLGAIINIDIGKVVSAIIKNSTSLLAAKIFTLDTNYPEVYLSYVDVEGHGLSAVYGATLVDIEIGTYEKGRSEVSLITHGWTGDVGLQLFNFQGIHLIRTSVEEKCCSVF